MWSKERNRSAVESRWQLRINNAHRTPRENARITFTESILVSILTPNRSSNPVHLDMVGNTGRKKKKTVPLRSVRPSTDFRGERKPASAVNPPTSAPQNGDWWELLLQLLSALLPAEDLTAGLKAPPSVCSVPSRF